MIGHLSPVEERWFRAWSCVTASRRKSCRRAASGCSSRCGAQASPGYVLFDQHYIQYFTAFGFLSTERPVVFAQSAAGDMVAFVPEFEVERVRAETTFERVESYPEYPGIEHPMRILARVLADMGIQGSIGADQDGYPGILGYQGPALSETTSSTRRAARVRDRGDDGAEERERARPDPRERPLVRACAPAAAGVLPARRHRGRGQPAGRPRGDARDAGRHSATASAASRGRPTARRPATAVRSACAAPGRMPSRTTSSSRWATCS